MAWTCRLVTAPGPGGTPFQDLRAGDMWFAPYLLEEDNPFRACLSPRYWALPEPRRAPLVVRLPGPCDFMLDTLAWHSEVGTDGKARQVFTGNGWDVQGEAPRLTLSPSINIGGVYHGYLQNGVITDDCEGRTFNADGRR